jgi:hypothetical protein
MLWIDSAVADWDIVSGSWLNFGSEPRRRPYEMWNHARSVLAIDATRDQRIDGVTTMKRAINLRLRQLEELYHLRKLPILGRPNAMLDLLCRLGIAQPNMVRRLTDIRNAVEHEDADPPQGADCDMFLELVWYFLRSTDRLVEQAVDTFELIPPDATDEPGPYWLEISLGKDLRWPPTMFGWLPEKMTLDQSVTGWAPIRVEKMNTRAEHRASLTASLKAEVFGDTGEDQHTEFDPLVLERGTEPEDVFIRGVIDGPPEFVSKLVRRYFELA